MVRTCTICSHEKRDAIEAAIVAGTPYRNIAKQYGSSPAAITRHTTEHIPQSIKQAHEAKQDAQALDVVKQLREINEVARAVMREALAAKKNGTALFAIDRIQKQLELQAKLLGDIDERPQVNVWLLPEWRTMRETIITALSPYPDARIAVASALAQMEDSRARLN